MEESTEEFSGKEQLENTATTEEMQVDLHVKWSALCIVSLKRHSIS